MTTKPELHRYRMTATACFKCEVSSEDPDDAVRLFDAVPSFAHDMWTMCPHSVSVDPAGTVLDTRRTYYQMSGVVRPKCDILAESPEDAQDLFACIPPFRHDQWTIIADTVAIDTVDHIDDYPASVLRLEGMSATRSTSSD